MLTFFIAFIIYSIIGFIFFRDYSLKCHEAGVFPFGENYWKYYGCSFLCGGITSGILLISLVYTTYIMMKNIIAIIIDHFKNNPK